MAKCKKSEVAKINCYFCIQMTDSKEHWRTSRHPRTSAIVYASDKWKDRVFRWKLHAIKHKKRLTLNTFGESFQQTNLITQQATERRKRLQFCTHSRTKTDLSLWLCSSLKTIRAPSDTALHWGKMHLYSNSYGHFLSLKISVSILTVQWLMKTA